MEAIILAGGLGTRLAARLNGLPKAMAPVGGRPFLNILLSQLKRLGFERVILSVGHLHSVIEKNIGRSFNGMRIDYAMENIPLGTGGAIRFAMEQAEEESILVMNGDTFLDADYAAMLQAHTAQLAELTIAVAQVDDVSRYGGVLLKDNHVEGFEEKGRSGPGWINAGSYVLTRNFPWPAALSERFSFERDLLAAEVGRRHPPAFVVTGFFLDIGVPDDLDRAQSVLAQY
jgi:D-glycero-alpha-D-manno-heptose 1-phosphate guanylyltransferase